jgi:hypothetical protein
MANGGGNAWQAVDYTCSTPGILFRTRLRDDAVAAS